MPVSASVDELAMVRLVEAGPFTTPRQVADFLDASDEPAADGGMSERATMVDNLRLQGIAETPSSWDTFLVVVGAIESIAGVVTSITSAISGVYAVATL